MKPQHDKVATEEFTPGSTYRVAMNGNDLYDAEVVKFHGGCWATVRVEKPAEGEAGKGLQARHGVRHQGRPVRDQVS